MSTASASHDLVLNNGSPTPKPSGVVEVNTQPSIGVDDSVGLSSSSNGLSSTFLSWGVGHDSLLGGIAGQSSGSDGFSGCLRDEPQPPEQEKKSGYGKRSTAASQTSPCEKGEPMAGSKTVEEQDKDGYASGGDTDEIPDIDELAAEICSKIRRSKQPTTSPQLPDLRPYSQPTVDLKLLEAEKAEEAEMDNQARRSGACST
jgi:hypothetical protein